MGPQLDSCGRKDQLRHERATYTASMGPQLDSCGRPARLHCLQAWIRASMGPQLDSCGRMVHGRHARPKPCALQWGRNLTVAEGADGRGLGLGGRHASMGPQLDSCGRAVMRKRFVADAGLQWGRNLTVAEGGPWPDAPSPRASFNGAAT